jgi:hypothetical protein
VRATAIAVAALLLGRAAAALEVGVEGTAFRVVDDSGRVLAQEELIGLVLTLADPEGQAMAVRIDGVEADPRDPEITLYTLSTRDPASGQWQNACAPGPDGRRQGFPLAGRWTLSGEHVPDALAFNLTCTAGAIGKCVRFGYKPWRRLPDGTTLRDHHQACVRMMRADYCGDGRSFTRDGTLIDLYDRLGIQKDEPAPGMRFEAGWAKDGAVCIARVRIPENATLEALERLCPARLAGRTGAACSEVTTDGPEVLLRNRS